MSSVNLPKFENPPVIETVLGIQFDTLPNFTIAHLGAFWQRLGPDKWPHVNDAPSLDTQSERFGEENRGRIASMMFKLSRSIEVRLQIRNNDKTRMIQVQNGRLHYNWLGHTGDQYPNYEKVKPEFDRVWDDFQGFLSEYNLGNIHLNQWEVTYVNHIPQGTIWNDPQDWIDIFPLLTTLPTKTTEVKLESFGGEWHFEIEPNRGRLHVNISHGWQKEPQENRNHCNEFYSTWSNA